MAFSFNSTAGNANANSYISVSRANDVLGGQLDDGGWSDASDQDKEKALVGATECIEGQALKGSKYDTDVTDGEPDQALHFPRGEDCYESGGSTVVFVPENVEKACAHQAAAILGQFNSESVWGPNGRQQLQREGVQAITFAGATERFRRGVHDMRTNLCPEARRLLRGFARKALRTLSERQVRDSDAWGTWLAG